MKKYDFILIGVVLAVAAVLFVIISFTGTNGKYVSVEVDGKVVQTLKLSEDTELVIEGKGGKNTLVISDGFAEITEADCPDKICVHHKKISKSGETIICLPHRVMVSITDEGGDEIDAVS